MRLVPTSITICLSLNQGMATEDGTTSSVDTTNITNDMIKRTNNSVRKPSKRIMSNPGLLFVIGCWLPRVLVVRSDSLLFAYDYIAFGKILFIYECMNIMK